jgi:hypothetical protein
MNSLIGVLKFKFNSGMEVVNIVQEVLYYINNFHPTIKSEFEYSYERVHFLDTSIYINNLNLLESDLFIKPTDKALLLHNGSFHPNNCKTSIIYSQALRYVTYD